MSLDMKQSIIMNDTGPYTSTHTKYFFRSSKSWRSLGIAERHLGFLTVSMTRYTSP